MSAAIESMFKKFSAVQVTGSNGADILAALNSEDVSTYEIAILSESNGQLVIGWVDMESPQSETWNIGDWVLLDSGTPWPTKMPNSDVGRYCAIMPRLIVGVGMAEVEGLLEDDTTSVEVEFDEEMPDISYILKWRAFSGTAILSQLVLDGSITKTVTGATIPLKAVSACDGGLVMVEAFKTV